MKQSFFLIVITILLSCQPIEKEIPGLNSKPEVRAAWLDFTSDDWTQELMDIMIGKITQANMNTIFVVTPPCNGNSGSPSPENFSSFVHQATEAGINVHVCVVSRYRISKEEPADYTQQEERDAQLEWAISLLTEYPELKGFHLDYIRYTFTPMDEIKREAVTQTVNSIHSEVMNQFPGKKVSAAVFHSRKTWAGSTEIKPDWFTNWLAKANNLNGYYDPVSVPVHLKFQQNPVEWISNNKIDYICPMVYVTDNDCWKTDLNMWKSFLGEDISKVVMGIGWFEANIDAEDIFQRVYYDPAAVVQKIKMGREAGVGGFSIFEINAGIERDQELIDALTIDSEVNDFNAPFKHKVSSPL